MGRWSASTWGRGDLRRFCNGKRRRDSTRVTLSTDNLDGIWLYQRWSTGLIKVDEILLYFHIISRNFLLWCSKGTAIIPRVRRSEDGVYVKFGGLRICQKHTRVVVELHNDDGALDPIIEWVVIAPSSYPAEISLVKMAFHLIQTHFPCLFR